MLERQDEKLAKAASMPTTIHQGVTEGELDKPVNTEDIVKKNLEQNNEKSTPGQEGVMNPYEEEQMELLRQMSMREEEDRKSIANEEERILKQVMDLSSKEQNEEGKNEEEKNVEEKKEEAKKKKDLK